MVRRAQTKLFAAALTVLRLRGYRVGQTVGQTYGGFGFVLASAGLAPQR